MRADCLPHANVVVRVNGEVLTEYQTEDEALTAATFIEATPGAHFSVGLNLDAGFAYRDPKDRILFKVHVDGLYVRSHILTTHLKPVVDDTIAGAVDTKDGVSTLKRCSDGQADASLIKKLANMGEIRIELRRCREIGLATVQDNASRFKHVGEDTIPEKAMKGRSTSSHAKLGRPEATPTVTTVNIEYPHGKDAIAVYVFQYRTRRDLEIEGIIERPPSPVPLADRNPDDLTPDELREQVRLLRARESMVNVKQEFKREKRSRQRSVTLGAGEDDEEGNVTVTGQWDRRKRARASADGEDVVDLTEE